jgi:hypothetical protein
MLYRLAITMLYRTALPQNILFGLTLTMPIKIALLACHHH